VSGAALPVQDTTPRMVAERAGALRPAPHLFVYPGTGPAGLRRAQPHDASAIHALLETHVAQGKVLPRTLDQVHRAIRDFVVAVDGERIVGCGALRLYSDTLAEVAALAIAADWQGRGVGRRIVETLKTEAAELGIARVLALTLEEGFFHRLGFRTVDIGTFPEKIERDCASCAKRTHCIEIAVLHETEPAGNAGRE
jgi:amino-acid N-acetyltransferase